ncbi:MAG TPA: Ig-like domain-containing protein, partial [Candidatus Sulfotelmatobacter sp.]|nr:Ig-like domain-containing protein [Candidatus Sulfotelmatobacter sp.]
LNAGQSCRIGVVFTPGAVGARSATLTLLDNTLNGEDNVTLAGIGVLPSPTFTITAPANGATFTSGTAVTFSVKVSSASGPQPTGKVQFKVDGANYGTAVTVSSTGTASTSVTGLTTTTHTLSATYSGDTNYAAAGPVSVSITIKAAATLKFTSPTSGQTVPAASLPVSVTVTSKTSPVPIGNVTFSVDGAQVGAPVKLVSGAASMTTGSLTAGSHTILAVYSGDKYHRATKASETVNAQ